MSKLSLRLVCVVLVLFIQSSLLICGGEGCWNEGFALPIGHPTHQMLSWMMELTPFSLSTVQCIAQVLLVVEGVFVVDFCFGTLCNCILFAFQCAIIGLALTICYKILQQNPHTTFVSFMKTIDQLF
jgi:hypothetical protein